MTDDRNAEDRPFDVLLLDFGGVCLLNPVELHDRAEAVLGLAAGTLRWLGPIDPATDDLWRELLAGGLTERDYWARRAAEVGTAAGRPLDTREYMRLVYDPPTPQMIRSDATDVAKRALAAGYGVSVLTNDLRAFHGTSWQRQIPFLDLIDHLVDCSDTGVLKPDPRAFEHAATEIGVALDRMLFVDDQPANVAGAEAVGLETIHFDIAEPELSWGRVADRLQLDR
ncbi:MAG: HAD-IA family hydrolase [Acidimicrobiales bacterium]